MGVLVLYSGCGSGLRIGEPPVLYNLTVDIQTCAPLPCIGGAFNYLATETEPTFFGGTVIGPSGPKIIPNIEFKVREDADVISPMRGIVSAVETSQQGDDFSIRISPGALSAYTVEIDHVLSPTVEEGDLVEPGQVLGKPGVWNGSPLGRVEIQVNRGGDYVCPMDYLHGSVKASMRAKVTQLMADWESVKSSTTLYDESAMVVPGCLVHSIAD
jgi:hypothetical protein